MERHIVVGELTKDADGWKVGYWMKTRASTLPEWKQPFAKWGNLVREPNMSREYMVFRFSARGEEDRFFAVRLS